MIDEILIKSEEDAWNALQKALSDELTDTAQLSFEGWPVFKLTIKGKDFKGSIPTRVMPPILDLQKEIYRIYCEVKYHTEDTRRLTLEDRDLLELIVSVKPGSTKFFTDLVKVLNEIVKNSNMSGKEAVILLVSLSAILATSVGWKDWVGSRERAHGQEITVRLSEQETERLKLVTEALSKSPELQKNKQYVSEFKGALSKKLKSTDQIKINDIPIIDGERAAEIAPTPRKQAEEIRLDGEFLIKEVRFPKKYGGKYRFSVIRLIDDKSFSVDVSPDKLSPSQITILKDGGFGVKKVLMEINAKELRGRISGASLVSIKWPDNVQ